MLQFIHLLALLLGALLLIGCYFLTRLYPQPLPGIPYVPESRRRVWGDLPAMIAHRKEHGSMTNYMSHIGAKRDLGPIYQLFVRPFSRPWVIVTDATEFNNIMTRRIKEFDRADMFSDLFRAYAPYSQVTFRTNEEWAYNRRLVSDALLPEFLSTVSSKRIYGAVLDLVDLWSLKSRLANGNAVEVLDDVHSATMDVIWAATFGSDMKAVRTQSEHLSQVGAIFEPRDEKNATLVELPRASPPALKQAITALQDSSHLSRRHGATYHWVAINFAPGLRRAKATLYNMISQSLTQALETFREFPEKKSGKVRCVLDLVVQKELASAEKNGRQPMSAITTKHVHGELAFFLFAGASTTGDELCWALKKMTAAQSIQKKIRDSIVKSVNTTPGTQIAYADIINLKNPYLDAFIHEVLRCHPIVNGNSRQAMQDTQILGYDIPKGTEVFGMISGPTFLYPASHQDRKSYGHQPALEKFEPGRWLTPEGEFDPYGGPMQTFGAGPRGCFGRKFAMLEMRMLLTMILWNFELLPIPQSLEDWGICEEMTQNAKNVRLRLRRI